MLYIIIERFFERTAKLMSVFMEFLKDLSDTIHEMENRKRCVQWIEQYER